ncbi:PepSY-associated TM helix domain-containing protein [Bacteroides clarus]|uniref:PepSY-associated TM helix domain-containing protein n=1 Tax=Bacteroides clarus TaxID=626929 RepID=UPI0026662E2B|nr:PepSY-associated TM helix domain-containing protein [Bacteroides clarus]
MKKAFRKIHLWLSVPFGLIITVICLSGAALVFEDEVTELCRRDLYYVEKVSGAPLPVEYLIEKVAGTLPDSVAVTGVSISSDAERAYQVNLSKPRRASVYVDQYTGEVKGRHERAPFFLTMFKLHRWLLDGMKPDGGIFWGKMIVGVSTLMFVFVLISGIVIWWPRTKKALKNSLKIAVGKGRRRFWYDLHVAGGMYALVLLLAMALTGLTWSFSWYRAGFYKVFGVEMKQRAGHGALQTAHGTPQTAHGTLQTAHGTLQTAHGTPQTAHGGKSGRNSSEEGRGNREHTSSYACWQQVYEELKARNAGYKQITVSNGSASVSFERFGNQRAADRYAFNPQDGEITEVTLYKDTDASGKMRGWIYSVHVGSWGGMFTRILTFIAALLGGTLPLTGYYLWLRRIRLI